MRETTKVWLYKARDVAASGEPRPGADKTRAFAVDDGILCRSAYTRAGERPAWIPNVQNVEAGDILLLFFRQLSAQPAILFLGSFRVLDPGSLRLNESCDLAVVKDPGLMERLRAEYGIPRDEPVTGWLLTPAPDVIPPAQDEPAIEEFLARRASLVEYHGRLRLAESELAGSPTPSGHITSVALDAITVHSNMKLECSPGINVLIGENGSGKTHILKCMYAVLRAAEEATRGTSAVAGKPDKLERVLGGPVRSLFAPEDAVARVRVECERGKFEREETLGGRAAWSLPDSVRPRVMFLPSREVLAMFTGFARLYEDRDIPFDETYYDLCRELSRFELREAPETLAPEISELQSIIGGPVRLDASRFVVDTPNGPLGAPVVAEGHRKLACVAYLMKNGALTPETTLFWDEPEANLNPKLIRTVAQLIRRLAKAGVQFFIATHDYLLARELSMEAEYERADDTRFFALYRTSPGAPVTFEWGTRWSDLQKNPIFEAFAAHYDHEQSLFAGAS